MTTPISVSFPVVNLGQPSSSATLISADIVAVPPPTAPGAGRFSTRPWLRQLEDLGWVETATRVEDALRKLSLLRVAKWRAPWTWRMKPAGVPFPTISIPKGAAVHQQQSGELALAILFLLGLTGTRPGKQIIATGELLPYSGDDLMIGPVSGLPAKLQEIDRQIGAKTLIADKILLFIPTPSPAETATSAAVVDRLSAAGVEVQTVRYLSQVIRRLRIGRAPLPLRDQMIWTGLGALVVGVAVAFWPPLSVDFAATPIAPGTKAETPLREALDGSGAYVALPPCLLANGRHAYPVGQFIKVRAQLPAPTIWPHYAVLVAVNGQQQAALTWQAPAARWLDDVVQARVGDDGAVEFRAEILPPLGEAALYVFTRRGVGLDETELIQTLRAALANEGHEDKLSTAKRVLQRWQYANKTEILSHHYSVVEADACGD